jgi:hypothetical protein
MGNQSYFDERHINFNNEKPHSFLLSHTNNDYLLENINPYDNYSNYNNQVYYEDTDEDEINLMDNEDDYDDDDNDSHG